ncbi:GNAT family N-acetyltransferase [Microbulbifer sp. TYP-18]|uniref:GNAT family N-acetyltransferase n=1 Tax=Microbulbifer sp. TYP-18 TaxID=3230024 RepID=UPI0034C64DE1
MNSLAARTESMNRRSGTLPDGRRWDALERGFRCQLNGGVLIAIDYISGGESARITGPSGGIAAAELDQWFDWLFALNPALQRIVVSAPGRIRTTAVKEVSRVDFYSRSELWYRGNNGGNFPLQWVESESGFRHPLRLAPLRGEIYRRHFYSLGMDLSLRHLDPEQDLELFTQWMNQRRVARFWEEAGDIAKQRRYIDQVLQDPHKSPLIASFDDVPFGYFEIYWAMEDRIGPHCDAQPYDRGFHLLVGNKRFLGNRFTRAWLNGVSHFLFLDDNRTQTLVGEPRADNVAMLKYLNETFGWQKIAEFDFPHKRAALVQCERDIFFRAMGGV